MSVLKICPTCTTEYPANERFCPRDGTALRSQGGGTGDLVGSVIAERYHILKKLGEGGMGQVYLAEHVKMGRKSAVKVMNPSMVNDADAIGRFNREAANASRINHPNVAGIYDFGETSDGLVYLAMEFIEGETLTAILKSDGALPALRAANITRQVAEGLNVAHEMGIVHRDLKPDNIMVTKDSDGDDVVKVVDFGIAKSTGSDGQKVTRTGLVVGTPEYMSPEQLAGDKLDGRTDLYSLALVAFNMLTGHLPFPSETTQSSMIMRLTEKPKSLHDMKPDIVWPREVQEVMDKALAREKENRYAKAREFGRALYQTVERMPRSSLTDAGTLVLQAPVVGAAANAGAPKPVAAPVKPRATPAKSSGSKVPLLVGGLVVVAAAAGGFFYMQRGSQTAAASPAASTAASPAASSVTSSAAVPAASVPAPDPAPIATVTQAPVAAAPVTPPPSITKELDEALRNSARESKARKALSQADSLQARAVTSEDKATLTFIRMQAHGVLGEEKKACQALRDGIADSKGTKYESMFSELVKRCS